MKQGIEKIRFFVSDIDGVLTDGKIFYQGSSLQRFFCIKDGVAFRLLKIAGIKTVLVSGRKSKATAARFGELGLDFYYEGIDDKVSLMVKFLSENGGSWEEISYMGDDLPDLPVIQKSGISFAPGDASEEVRRAADYVCAKNGGEGAFREAAEFILKEQKKWEETLRKFFSS